MKIISLHNGHDASISAFEDDQILWHWEMERVLNKKHWCGVDESNELADVLYNHCLPRLHWKPEDIDVLVFAGHSEWARTEFAQFVPKYDPRNLQIPWSFGQIKLRGSNRLIDCYSVVHHVNHAAYAYYTSPFTEAMVYTLDGIGDGTMSMAGYGVGNFLNINYDFVNKCPPGCTPNGIGLFYSYMGHIFPFLGTGNHSWLSAPGKIMGLSSYGQPRDIWREPIRREMLSWMPSQQRMEQIPSQLGINTTDPMSKDTQDLAATVQDELELYILQTVDQLFCLGDWPSRINYDSVNYQQYPDIHKNRDKERVLCMAGGCALNVQANSRLLNEKIVDKLYIPPAVSDCGISLGAALYVYWNILNEGTS